MADFSLPRLYVVPVGNTLPSSGSTDALTPGKFGIFLNTYAIANAGNIAAAPYFYLDQGRSNNYAQISKRSDKIDKNNIIDWYKTVGSATAAVQISTITNWHVQCGESVTVTLRAHSYYIDALYFNGFTRSVTVQAPCCDCEDNPCEDVPVPALIDSIIAKFNQAAPGTNPDNISFSTFYNFQRIGDDENAYLLISGKPLTSYGTFCDIALNPYQYDRMWFRAWAYTGPATTQDFIVYDNCDQVAQFNVTQRSSYPSGTSEQVAQTEINYHSYGVPYMKDLFRNSGYNQNFESWVTPGTVYDLYYIKYRPYNEQYTWASYVKQDAEILLAIPQSLSAGIETVLAAALGTPVDYSSPAESTTTTTSTTTTSTTSTTTLIP